MYAPSLIGSSFSSHTLQSCCEGLEKEISAGLKQGTENYWCLNLQQGQDIGKLPKKGQNGMQE